MKNLALLAQDKKNRIIISATLGRCMNDKLSSENTGMY